MNDAADTMILWAVGIGVVVVLALAGGLIWLVT